MQGRATIRFYEELNDFLPPHLRKETFSARFQPGDTVKALIESLGVPHTEVDLVLVNGESVGFQHRLRDGDRMAAYPVFESLEIGAVSRVRPVPLREPRFVLDVHLGRLARLLRMLGFDSAYSNTADDGSLAAVSCLETRIVLTRDRELLKRTSVSHGYCVRSADPTRQLLEVLRRFDLRDRIHPFSLCLRCNSQLGPVSRQEAAGRVPAYVLEHYREFRSCPECSRLYWRGSHWENMRNFLKERLDGPAPGKGSFTP
jgi:uncharacterized protein with PIN domain/sulfur carrier protein ThiS